MVIILKKSNKRFFSIRWRLVYTYFFIILLTLFVLTIYMLDSIKQYFFDREGIELLTRANIIANIISGNIEYKDESINKTIQDLEINKRIRVIITGKEANVLFDTAESNNLKGKIFLNEEIINALKGKDDVASHHEEGSGWILNAAVPIIREREMIGVVYLSTSAEHIVDFINDIRKKMYVISVIVSIFIGFFSSILAKIITAPILNLTAVIRHVPDEGLTQTVEVTGNDEIAQLGMAFNKMSERLNEVEEKRREFVSNASHELRTPLSSIKVLVESLLQLQNPDLAIIKEFLTDINHEIDRLSRIINKLLMLTKMDVFYNEFEMKKMNVKELILSVRKSLLPLARQKDIKINVQIADDISVMVDEDKIWEAIFNIADNSIKYTPAKGEININAEQKGDNVIIEVRDNGIGIPQTEITKIFDRFYRVDKARARETGGTGLGLSIALSAVRLHGGDIQVHSEEGKGSVFTVVLPTDGQQT